MTAASTGRPGPTSPGAPTLILVPTVEEARCIEDARRASPAEALFSICGFGPVAAAAAAARKLALLGPRRVLLLGIAGTYDAQRHPVGAALAFTRVSIDGIGAGEGDAALGPRELGLPQWRADEERVFDELPLALPRRDAAPDVAPDVANGASLLTVCSCSATAAEAERRRARFDGPAAEDMEAFGVALACHLEGVPLAVVRGLSNEVGDRDPKNWRIAPAMEAAWELARAVLADRDWRVPR